MKGPIFNQDSTEFFYVRDAREISGEAVDDWVDNFARIGIGTVVRLGERPSDYRIALKLGH